MNNDRRGLGAFLGIACLGLLLFLGVSLLGMKSGPEKEKEDEYPPIIPSSNPFMVQDQISTRRISAISRNLKDDHDKLLEEYNRIPAFKVPDDPHLDQRDIEKYITVYRSSVEEISYFKNRVVGRNPGVFRVVALYGMVANYYELVRLKSLVKHRMTQEEFEWLKQHIMEAALFCVQDKLDHGQLTEDEERRLTDLRESLYLNTGVKEMLEDASYVYHMENLHLETVPRSNIELFLDNYTRINYHKVHFAKPTLIKFDREAIMRAAADNPP